MTRSAHSPEYAVTTNPPRPHVTTTIFGNSTCSAHIRPSKRWVHSLVRPAPRAFFRPDRQNSQPPRAGPVKAGRVFLRGHPKGFAVTGPRTDACWIGSGLQAIAML